MHLRIQALVLSAMLAMTLLACSKKEPAPGPPAATVGSMAPNQPAAGQPADQQSQQTAASSAQMPAQQQQQQMAPAAAAPEPPPPPPPLVVPAGTHLVVRMGSTISTKTANQGETFMGSLANAVAVHGVVAITAGAGVTGTVITSRSPGKFKGEGVLTIAVASINVGGAPMSVETSPYTQTVKGKGKRTAVAIGGGGGAGALIGGIAGGGKGALIGGVVGAGAGTAGAAFTGNKELEIPAESVVTFKLASPITVHRVAPNAMGQMNQ